MIQELTKEQYEHYIEDFNDYHFIQSAENDYQNIVYGNCTYIGYFEKELPVILFKFGVAHILGKQKLALGSFGPIIQLSRINDRIFESFTKELLPHLKQKDITCLQMYPVLLNDRNPEIEKLLSENKYIKPSPWKFTPIDGTMLVDLEMGIDEMYQSLRKDVRTNIKKTMKDKDLHIKIIENIEDSDINAFLSLYAKQRTRKNFEDHVPFYYEYLMRQRKAVLFNAIVNDEIVSSILAIKFQAGKSLITYLSASIEEAFKHEAPTLLRWKLINWAKENGYKKVDFFSIYKTTPSVTKFKLGFRPQVIDFPQNAYDLVVKPEIYYTYQFYSSGKRILNGIEVFAKGLLKNHK